MEKITLTEISQFTRGEQIGNAIISNVSIDSRKIGENCLFVGIKGENYDGNDFVEDAVSNGAVAVLTSKQVFNVPQVRITDTNQAFLDFAKGYLRKIRYLKTVAITGSVGKTTTKEMMYSILCEMGKSHKTEGNFNNLIGVPLTIFNIAKNCEYSVIEMGMSELGEISSLSKTVCPNIAIITNIGSAHIGKLGSTENILKAKLEIAEGLTDKLIVNGDDPLLRNINIPKDTVFYGIQGENLHVTAKNIEEFEDYTTFTAVCFGEEFPILLNTQGLHNVLNSLSAIAVAYIWEASIEQITSGLKAFKNTGMRQNVFEYNGYKIIEDCYNASVDSMKAGLSVLESTRCNQKIAVLGAMGELGSYSNEAHREVLKVARQVADRVYLYGEAWRKVELFDAKIYENKQVLAMELNQKIKSGDAVLFKGSRAEKIEEVLKLLMNEEK